MIYGEIYQVLISFISLAGIFALIVRLDTNQVMFIGLEQSNREMKNK